MILLAQLICFGAAIAYIKYVRDITADNAVGNKHRRKLIKRQRRHLEALAQAWNIPHILQIVEIWRAEMEFRPSPPVPIAKITAAENLEIMSIAKHGKRHFSYLFEELGWGKLWTLQIQFNRARRYAPDLIETKLEIEMTTAEEVYWVHTYYPAPCPYTMAQFLELPMGGDAGFSYIRHYGYCAITSCAAKLPAWRNCRSCQQVAGKDLEGITYATCLECDNEQHIRDLSKQRYCEYHISIFGERNEFKNWAGIE